MMLVALAGLADQAHPLVRWGGVAWGVALGVHYWIQWRLESEWADESRATGMRACCGLLSSCCRAKPRGAWSSWPARSLCGRTSRGSSSLQPPSSARRDSYGSPCGRFERFADAYLAALTPLVIFSAVWVLFAIVHPGDPAPLPYVLLVNPLELAQSLVVAILVKLPSRALSWVSARDRSLAGVAAGIRRPQRHHRARHALLWWRRVRCGSAVVFGPLSNRRSRSSGRRSRWRDARRPNAHAAHRLVPGAALLLVVVAKFFSSIWTMSARSIG